MNAVAKIEVEEFHLPPAGSLSLTLPESLSFDGWQSLGRELAAREKVLNWWIGDWWVFGEHRYGERAALAAKGLFPQSFETLRNIGSVARAFPATSRQHDVLSFTHHQEIAPLARQNPSAATELLTRVAREIAEGGKFSAAQLRAAVRVMRNEPLSEVLRARDEDPDHYEVLTIARAWNRAKVENRQTFMELAHESGFEDIDP